MVGKRAARMLNNPKNRTARLPTLHQMEATPLLLTLNPFNFQQFNYTNWIGYFSLVDGLQNIFLFIPLGIILLTFYLNDYLDNHKIIVRVLSSIGLLGILLAAINWLYQHFPLVWNVATHLCWIEVLLMTAWVGLAYVKEPKKNTQTQP